MGKVILVHRVTGVIDQQQAAQGAGQALRFVQRLSSEHGPLNLVLDPPEPRAYG